jgi:hypothetical protein
MKEFFASATSELVLNGYRDESTTVAFHAIDAFDEVGGEGYGDALGLGHRFM